MTALGVALVGLGVLLVASGVKDYDPRQVAYAIVTGKPIAKDPTNAPATPGTSGQSGTTPGGGAAGGGAAGGGGGGSWGD